MTGLQTDYIVATVFDRKLLPATWWCRSAVDLHATIGLCRHVHAVYALECDLTALTLFKMKMFPGTCNVAIPISTPVGLRAQVLAMHASECDCFCYREPPDTPLAGDIQIWLFSVQGEKRRFKWGTLYRSGMSDYVMPVLIGLYAAFAITAMAVTPFITA